MPELDIGQIKVVLGERPKGGAAEAATSTARALSLADARRSASFDFKTASSASLELREVVHIEGDAELVVLTYSRSAVPGGRPGWFTVVQAPLAQYGSGAYIVVGDQLAPTDVGGAKAASVTMQGTSPQATPLLHLVWTDGEVLRHVIGDGLHGVDLGEVARSLA